MVALTRSRKRLASAAGLPGPRKENEHPRKHAKCDKVGGARRPLEPTTRGNIQKASANEDKDSKERPAGDILPGPVLDVLQSPIQNTASQKSNTSGAADVLEDPSPSDGAISKAESLRDQPPVNKSPSSSKPGNREPSAEAKDHSPGGNEIIADISSPPPSAPAPECASEAGFEGNTLIPEEEEYRILGDYEIVPETSPPPPPSAKPDPLPDIEAAGNALSESGKHSIPSDHEIVPDIDSPPAPARRPEPASAADPEVSTWSGEAGNPSLGDDNKTVSKPDTLQDHISSDNETIPAINSSPTTALGPEFTSHAEPENTRLSLGEVERILAAIDPSLLDPWEPMTPPELNDPNLLRRREPTTPLELDDPTLGPLVKMPRMGYFPPTAQPERTHTHGGHSREEQGPEPLLPGMTRSPRQLDATGRRPDVVLEGKCRRCHRFMKPCIAVPNWSRGHASALA